MRRDLPTIAPAFVEMAHRTGMAVAATVDAVGRPRTRVVQPVWEWDGTALTGWMSTANDAPKYRHLVGNPRLSLTYWAPSQDTCSADCDVEVVDDDERRAAAWQRFLTTPEPAGFDPTVHPDWESATSPTFGVLRLSPTWLRVMPGTLMTAGTGEVWTWRRP